jgi:hypothetical protein
MINLRYWAAVIFVTMLGYGTYIDHQLITRNHVVATEQDIVRWCLDRRASHAPEGSIHWACTEMHGDYYIRQGFLPNYDKDPSYKLWGLKEAPTTRQEF